MAFNLLGKKISRYTTPTKPTYLDSLYPRLDAAITSNNFAAPRPNISSECCSRTGQMRQ